MAHRSLATRIWGPVASALRRHPAPGHLGPGVPPPPAHPRFLGTTRGQNDITVRRTPFDVERIRDDLKRYKIEDEIMRENLSWASRYYKTMKWSCYAALSFSTAVVIACEVVRKDKDRLQAGLICDQ